MQDTINVRFLSDKIIREGEDLSSFCLGVILIGTDKGSQNYLKAILKEAKNYKLKVDLFFKDEVTVEEVKEKIMTWNEDENVQGILLIYPLPASFQEENIQNLIKPEKDIDGAYYNTYLPTVVEAILLCMSEYHLLNQNKKIAIIGRSKRVGSPLYNILKEEDVDQFYRGCLPESFLKYDCIINTSGVDTVLSERKIKEDTYVFNLNEGKEDILYSNHQITTRSGLGYLATLFTFSHLKKDTSK